MNISWNLFENFQVMWINDNKIDNSQGGVVNKFWENYKEIVQLSIYLKNPIT